MSFLFNVLPGDVIYDIETYPNVFTLCAVHAETGVKYTFEISDRKNDTKLLCLWLEELQRLGCRMVGFNNLSFDYPVIHFIYLNKDDTVVHTSNVRHIYDKAMGCIQSKNKFHHMIWDDQQIVPQVDLFKIHHFDNKNRYTSLKVIEFNMRLDSIQDLPFKVGTELNSDQIDELIKYNRHDVFATEKFYRMSLDKIKFRETLSKKYGKNFINHNDTKIGKDYFVMQLEEKRPGSCYRVVDGKRKIMQTVRESVNLGDVILTNIKFDDPEFNRILSFFKGSTIKETKGVFKDLNCVVNGFKFDFGLGGIHGSVENTIIEENDDMIIEDWDVSSYYPSLAIVNSLYPEHLGHNFCEIYRDVYEQRKEYEKGTPENAMLKLALNGVYGDSNSEYSPFYDPKYTMSVTVNGQLLLCMLIEQFFKTKEVKLLQINTDGMTIHYPRRLKYWIHGVIKWWEEFNGLRLENGEYKKMFIRDVNSYIAVYPDDTVKRKGAYEYELEMHQNHSALVVARAAEAYLLHGRDIEGFIKGRTDLVSLDFMLRTKIPRGSILECGGKQVQNVSRYYVSNNGEKLEKIMPPKGKEGAYKRKNGLLDEDYHRIAEEIGDEWDERIHTKNKSVYEERRSGIHPSYLVTVCNNLSNLNGATFNGIKSNINQDFYIAEAKKLVDCFNGNT